MSRVIISFTISFPLKNYAFYVRKVVDFVFQTFIFKYTGSASATIGNFLNSFYRFTIVSSSFFLSFLDLIPSVYRVLSST